MPTLESKLNLILEEKVDKVKPGNIRKGIKIFNVTGTVEGGDVVLFETVTEMNQHAQDYNDGVYAVVASTNFEGAYKLVNATWVMVGDPTIDLSDTDLLIHKLYSTNNTFPSEIFLPDLTTFSLYYNEYEDPETGMLEEEHNVNIDFTDYDNNYISIGVNECQDGGTLDLTLSEFLKTFPFYVGVLIYNAGVYSTFNLLMADKSFTARYDDSGTYNYVYITPQQNTNMIIIRLYLNKSQIDESSVLDYVNTDGYSTITSDIISGLAAGAECRSLW